MPLFLECALNSIPPIPFTREHHSCICHVQAATEDIIQLHIRRDVEYMTFNGNVYCHALNTIVLKD
jgi:hypothetical protein